MFRSKRNAFVKRLWKHRLSHGIGDEADDTAEDTDAAAGDGDPAAPRDGPEGGDSTVKTVAQAMLRRLKEVQLALLVQAIECRGGEPSSCVLVPRGELRLGRRMNVSPHVLCCQLWRWPDLRTSLELKRLSCCGAADDPAYVCCNPYHWSRLCKPESPPPPYSRYAQERFKPEDRAPSEPVSVATGGTNQYGSYSSHHGVDGEDPTPRTYWCNLAYWELRTRVGRLFPVHQQSVNVFSDLPHADGLCLGALTAREQQPHQPSGDGTTGSSSSNSSGGESVRRTREKIGYGLSLSREADGVWAYNRSDHPIFVNSPTLQQPPPGGATSSSSSRSFVVYKVPSGHSIKIFDFEKALYYRRLKDAGPPWSGGQTWDDGPLDPNSVRISFAKGWGPKYSRQVITSCPCWLEVLLVVPR